MDRSEVRILVVDNEENIVFAIKRMLNQAGYRWVALARDGKQGSEIIFEALPTSCFYHLIISDVLMPFKTGPQMVAEIKDSLSRGSISWSERIPKVIFMSACLPEGLTKESLLKSGQIFLEKPFEREELLKAVAELLGPAGGQNAD